MEKKSFVLNVLLAVVLGAGLFVGVVWSAFQPNVVLSNLDIPAMAALVLIALLIEYLWKGTEKRAWAVQIVLAAVTFAVLPFAAGRSLSGYTAQRLDYSRRSEIYPRQAQLSFSSTFP